MVVATTTAYTLATNSWTQIADGTGGVTETKVQLSTVGAAILNLGTAAPSAGSNVGIVIADAEEPFWLTMHVGQKLYAKAQGSPVDITVMNGGA